MKFWPERHLRGVILKVFCHRIAKRSSVELLDPENLSNYLDS
jgi:hypothetical protein